MNSDTDGDGLQDAYEPQVGTDPTNPDTDGDGLWDAHECQIGTDPSSRDTDWDGLWDGHEVKKGDRDEFYTGTDPLMWDTDGDGVSDFEEDADGDHLANGREWRYDVATGWMTRWTLPRTADSDGDGVLDGHETYGNPENGNQTSDPRLRDTDGDRLTDDLDPRTWIKDYLPFSRVMGNSVVRGPVYPSLVTRGVPFTVEGWVEINTTAYSGGHTGNWRRAFESMMVQVLVIQDDVLIPISDPIATGDRGAFTITCTIGDDVGTGDGLLAVTTTHHQKVVYLPV
ncbi:MAG: hypothetical protein GWN18_03400, partial [Thermoplasmata archaeon]|nr:hypothetical protein [Thermoplasmata archaeon]NIS11067.1 hypothetical protein [Thermoplasmata archaeon]NIS19002.1 hypothetical protein [Thermoplasmata archaeon]NIT76055.1 hypothetical protein [Thermoplasmata archaeon]NIU48154.1 hypothetical protein [Thermoplasmata archaeon]